MDIPTVPVYPIPRAVLPNGKAERSEFLFQIIPHLLLPKRRAVNRYERRKFLQHSRWINPQQNQLLLPFRGCLPPFGRNKNGFLSKDESLRKVCQGLCAKILIRYAKKAEEMPDGIPSASFKQV
jgi:hypothetical protein